MVRPRQVPAAKTAGGHVEVSSVLLHHYVGGDLGCTEDRVLTLIERSFGMRSMKAGSSYSHRVSSSLSGMGVRSIPIDLVRRHVYEGGFGTEPSSRLQHVQGPESVNLKIKKWDCGGLVMRWLGRTVDDKVGADLFH